MAGSGTRRPRKARPPTHDRNPISAVGDALVAAGQEVAEHVQDVAQHLTGSRARGVRKRTHSSRAHARTGMAARTRTAPRR